MSGFEQPGVGSSGRTEAVGVLGATSETCREQGFESHQSASRVLFVGGVGESQQRRHRHHRCTDYQFLRLELEPRLAGLELEPRLAGLELEPR